MQTDPSAGGVARVNGVALHRPEEALSADALRQRACIELLRQAARAEGLLDAEVMTSEDWTVDERTSLAIEALLDRRLVLPQPSEEACRRHYAARPDLHRARERVRLRHILFAVTPGTNLPALRRRAEACLIELRCHDGKDGDAFGRAARALSNCPSAAQDGDLGWLRREECAPEIAREIFGRSEVGVLPRLVHSRHGLHVMEIVARDPGAVVGYEDCKGAVLAALRHRSYVTALRQYLLVLAGAAELEGVELDGATSPLVQ